MGWGGLCPEGQATSSLLGVTIVKITFVLDHCVCFVVGLGGTDSVRCWSVYSC